MSANVKTGGGAAYPIEGFDWLAGFDPEFETARRRLAEHRLGSEPRALPLRYREIVASVALAFMAYPTCETPHPPGACRRRQIPRGGRGDADSSAFLAAIPACIGRCPR